MQKNNFNTNDDGHDIEICCSYDCDSSRMYFEENFEMLQHESYYKTCIAFYTDNGNVDSSGLRDYKVKGLKSDIVRYLNECVYDAWSTRDYIDDMRTEVIGNMEDIYDLDDYNIELNKYNISIEPKNDIRIISVSGYSQGDYAKVVCDFTALKKVWGNTPKEEDLQKHLTRLFYDSPIYARFDIDGKEYYYYDYIDDEYEWEPETFAAGVAKDSGVPLEEIEAFLPDYPTYN